MANSNDIKANFSDFELQIRNGDWEVGNSDAIHIKDLGVGWLGHWREFPLAGVGIQRYNNAPLSLEEAKRQYRLQLETDGYRVIDIEIENTETIRINAERVITQSGI